jgi:hypothetical protein
VNSIIDVIQKITTKFVDLLLIPFSRLNPDWGLIFISALSGVLLIFVYGLVSNQNAIKNVKRKISASLLEVILYRHDIGQCLKAQGRMLWGGAKYFFLAVPPLIILMIPCTLILAQLNLRYEERPLKKGENLILTAKVADPESLMQTWLEVSPGLKSSEPLRVSEDKEIIWKVNAVESGKQSVKIINTAKAPLEKSVYVENLEAPLYSKLYNSWLWTVLYPRENPAFEKDFSEIKLSYPKGEHHLFSLKLHWIIIFFIVSLISGLVAAKFFKIEV